MFISNVFCCLRSRGLKTMNNLTRSLFSTHCVYKPQFLPKGTAVRDFFHPEGILLGVDEPGSEATLRQLYAAILQQDFQCPIHPKGCPPHDPPELLASVRSAELIKQVSNAFLAVKISYANVLADLCEQIGAHVQEVTHAVGLDPRIRESFLQAGIGFGRDRLTKDLRAFCQLVQVEGFDRGILQAAEDVNSRRLGAFFQKINRARGRLRLSCRPDRRSPQAHRARSARTAARSRSCRRRRQFHHCRLARRP